MCHSRSPPHRAATCALTAFGHRVVAGVCVVLSNLQWPRRRDAGGAARCSRGRPVPRAHPELVRADLEHDGARALVRVLFISTAYLHLQQSLLLVWARLTLCTQRRRAPAASEQSRGIDRRIGGADRRSLLLRAHRCGTQSLSLGTPTRHCHHRDATATGLGLHGHFPIQAIAQSKSSS